MSTNSLRALIGFLIAPGVPALAFSLVGLIFGSEWEAAFVAKILAIFGYLAALVVGIPVYFLLQRKGIHSLMVYLIVGALIGLACYVLYLGLGGLFNWRTYPDHVILLIKGSAGAGAIAVVCATVASAVFWLIAIKQQLKGSASVARK